MMGGAGLTQFVASGDGQHVVIFSAGPHQPAMMYAGTDSHMPYLVQQGNDFCQEWGGGGGLKSSTLKMRKP